MEKSKQNIEKTKTNNILRLLARHPHPQDLWIFFRV